MAAKVHMQVARPAYARLLAAKAQLAAELGRDVTNDETVEALLRCWESARACPRDHEGTDR